MKPTESATKIATAIATLCLIAETSAYVYRSFRQPPALGPVMQERDLSDDEWRRFISSGRTFGPRDAKVQLVEISDFECLACVRYSSTVDALLNEFAGRVAITYRHLPLTRIHANAMSAAVAAE